MTPGNDIISCELAGRHLFSEDALLQQVSRRAGSITAKMPSRCCPKSHASILLERAVELFSRKYMDGPERCTAMWHQLLTRRSMTARLRRSGHSLLGSPCDDTTSQPCPQCHVVVLQYALQDIEALSLQEMLVFGRAALFDSSKVLTSARHAQREVRPEVRALLPVISASLAPQPLRGQWKLCSCRSDWQGV